MKNEEAIEVIDHLGIKGSQDYAPHKIGEALTMAMLALEKQIPKKVDVIFCPSAGKVANICPSCGYDSFGDNEDKYCAYCGQAIDWGETNEN